MTSKKKAIKTISLLWITSLLGAGCAFLTQIILARKLGPEEFGIFSAALTSISLLIPLGGFGIAQFWLRSFGQEGWVAKRWLSDSFKFIGTSTFLVLILAISWATLGPHAEQMKHALIILSAYALGQILVELVSSKLQLEEEYLKLSSWTLLPHIFRLLLVLISISVTQEKATAQDIAISYSIIAIVITGLGIHQLFQMTSSKFALKGHENTKEANQTITIKTSIFAQSWPFGMANLFYLIYFQSGVILVNYITGNAEAGAYSVAFTIIAGIVLFPSVVYQKFLLPKMHRWSTHDKPKFYKTYREGNLIMLSIGIATMAAILLTPNKLFTMIFGKEYLASIQLLHLLALSIPIIFIISSISATLTTGDNIKRRVKYMGLAAIFNITLNAALIPAYGAIGACISFLASNIILCALFYNATEKFVFKNERQKTTKINSNNKSSI
ncbi:oligosaccharide flippase family protein [Pseudomonas laurylsulfatiphila]